MAALKGENMRLFATTLTVLVIAFALSGVAAADPGDFSTESLVRNSQFGDYPLTAAEQRLTELRREASARFDAQLRARDAAAKSRRKGSVGFAYTIYEEVSVPTYQQQYSYWCGPATNEEIFASPRISRSYAQSQLASEMGTTVEGTYVGAMRDNLNLHTTYDPSVAPNMPPRWIWFAYQPADVSQFVARHREDLSYNLPSIFNPRGKHPTQNLYLIGWTSDGGHYVAGGGYREDDMALVSDVKYVDPYQNPMTGTSLGPHWMNAGQLWSLIQTNTAYIVY